MLTKNSRRSLFTRDGHLRRVSWVPVVPVLLVMGCSSKPSAENVSDRQLAGSRKTEIDYAACLRAVIALDPSSDARRDIANGTGRPFLVEVTDPGVETYAPGLKRCRLEPDPSRRDERTIAGYTNPGDLNGYAAGRCSFAMARYQVAYNRALFRGSADHLSNLCGAAVRIDPAYPNYDEDLKRETSDVRSRL
jgi:hypothetical protein